jgi:hypothetical protein
MNSDNSKKSVSKTVPLTRTIGPFRKGLTRTQSKNSGL